MPNPTLTPRQNQVLRLLALGHTTKSVAHELGIACKTSEKHRTLLMKQIKVNNVVALTHFALANKIVTNLYQ